MAVSLKSDVYEVIDVQKNNNYRGASVLKEVEVGDTMTFSTTISDLSGASNGGYFAPTVEVEITKKDGSIISEEAYQRSVKRIIESTIELKKVGA